MNRTQRRAQMRTEKRAAHQVDQQQQNKPVNIQYGVSSTGHVVLQFSIQTPSIWLTPLQAQQMAEKILETKKLLEQRQQDQKKEKGNGGS